MRDERARLVQQVLDLQIQLVRRLQPTREWVEVDLTMPQFKVLFFLESEGSASMGQLASYLGVTLSTVTGIVDRLVEHGMVQREEDPQDRRLVRCRLSARGRETMEGLQQAGRSRLGQLLNRLSLDELHTVAVGLEVLTTAAGRESAENRWSHDGPGHAAVPWRSRAPATQRDGA